MAENYWPPRHLIVAENAAYVGAPGEPVMVLGSDGLVAGMARLVDAGHRVWLVSGNAPSVLLFKADALGIDPRVPRLGSLPHLDRAGLIRKALEGCSGPHLYVGDRPHDREAAEAAGVPFLGVGAAVPGDHPLLSEQAEAEHLVEAVNAILG